MATDRSDFLDFVKSGLIETNRFTAGPYYSAEGDTLCFYAEDVPSYAQRINEPLTVVLSIFGHRVIGIKIMGVRRIIGRMQRLKLDTSDLGVWLDALLIAQPDDPEMNTYESELQQFRGVAVNDPELQLS